MRQVLMAVAMLAGCAKQEPRLTYVDLQSAHVPEPQRYGIYEPPGWDRTTPLPLVVFLHGGGDDETAWDKHPVVTRTLDAWIGDGRLPPFLAVLPNGDNGFWRRWADGSHDYDAYVMDEVVPAMRDRYPIVPGPEGLHLMGISMGGAGTMYMGLDHLDEFASLTVWSAPILPAAEAKRLVDNGILKMFAPTDQIFGELTMEAVEAENAYTRLASEADLHGTRLVIGAGTADIPGAMKATRQFHEHLTAQRVPHRFVVYQGGHVYSAWSKVFPVALAWNLGAPAPEPASAWRVTEVMATP